VGIGVAVARVSALVSKGGGDGQGEEQGVGVGEREACKRSAARVGCADADDASSRCDSRPRPAVVTPRCDSRTSPRPTVVTAVFFVNSVDWVVPDDAGKWLTLRSVLVPVAIVAELKEALASVRARMTGCFCSGAAAMGENKTLRRSRSFTRALVAKG
jgi:hypothetical protein